MFRIINKEINKSKIKVFSLIILSIFVFSLPLIPVISHADDTIYESYHFSVDGKREALNDDILCDWGGMSDLFVWISVMQLKEAGQLDLEASAKSYLPDDFVSQVGFTYDFTILDLMNHTAGFQANQAGHVLLVGENFTSLEDWLISNKTPQIHEPGEYVAYSDYGVTLAAYIIEKVTGLAYYDYVHENILKPADMKETSIYYDFSDNDYVSKLTDSSTYRFGFYPSNSARGSMEDMAKLINAMVSDDEVIWKPETRDEFFTSTLKYRDASNMGDSRIAHGLAYYYEFANPVYGMKFQDLNGSRCLYISEDLKTFSIIFFKKQNLTDSPDYYKLNDLYGTRTVQTEGFHQSLADMESSYVKADTVVKGLYSFSSLFNVYTLKKLSYNTLAFSVRPTEPYLTQISNTVFESTDGECGHFYLSRDGKVLEFPYFDLITYPKWLKTLRVLMLVLYYIGLSYSSIVLPVSLLVLIIRAMKKSEEKWPRFHKYHMIQCGAYCFHGIVFHLMELSYMMGINSGIANASKLMYYIGAVLSVVYWMFFLRSGKSEECTVFNKVLYWSTGIFAVVQVVFSVAFGLIFIK